MRLKQVPIDSEMYTHLKTNLKTYQVILKRLIRNAKKAYFQKNFDKYKGDIKNTLQTINEILNRIRSPQNLPDADADSDSDSFIWSLLQTQETRCAHETSADKQWTAHIAYIHATDPIKSYVLHSKHVCLLHNRKLAITNRIQKRRLLLKG